MFKNKNLSILSITFLNCFFSSHYLTKIVYRHMSILNIGQFIIKYRNFYREVKQLLIFFGGSIKWHYHSQLFQPTTLLTFLI